MRLSNLSNTLQAQLPEGRFSFVNTRIVLRTGVNLRQIRPEQEDDAALRTRVEAALEDMGISIDKEGQL